MKLNIVKKTLFTLLYNYLVIFSMCNFMDIWHSIILFNL